MRPSGMEWAIKWYDTFPFLMFVKNVLLKPQRTYGFRYCFHGVAVPESTCFRIVVKHVDASCTRPADLLFVGFIQWIFAIEAGLFTLFTYFPRVNTHFLAIFFYLQILCIYHSIFFLIKY